MQNVQLIGKLEKKGGGTSVFGRRNWKCRFFRLTKDGMLSYYKTFEAAQEGEKPLKEPINVMHCEVSFASEEKDPDSLEFQLVPSGSKRTFRLRAR